MITRNIVLLGVAVSVGMLYGTSQGDQPKPATQPGHADLASAAFQARMAGDVVRAREILDKALDSGAAGPAVWFEAARLNFYLFDFDAAWRKISKAIELDPGNARYHFWAGQIATYNAVVVGHEASSGKAVADQMQKARAALERAVDLKKDFHEARYQLVNLYLRGPGRNAAAAEKQLAVLKGLDAVFGARAECLLHEGKDGADEAVRIWKPVVEAHPERPDAHSGMGNAYRGARQYEQALQQFEKARQLDPKGTELLLDIARCYQGMRNLDQQARYYREYLDMVPPNPPPLRMEAMRLLASVERKQGHTAEAERLQEAANKMDPRYGQRGAVTAVPDLFTVP